MAAKHLRCCICGDVDVVHEHSFQRVGVAGTRRSRYYCEFCWRILVQWLQGEVALIEEAERRQARPEPPAGLG